MKELLFFSKKKVHPVCHFPINELITDELKDLLCVQECCTFTVDHDGNLKETKGKLKSLDIIRDKFMKSNLVKELQIYNSVYYIDTQCGNGRYYIELNR